jgi:hypothetical protein
MANSNLSFKMCIQDIMALKPNQIHVTTIHSQANAIIERLQKLSAINDMLRSLDLKKIIKIQKKKKIIHLIHSFLSLQPTALLISDLKHLSHNTVGNTMPTCVWQRYDSQYCLLCKLGSNTKKKTEHN